jgi:hypothetical protein
MTIKTTIPALVVCLALGTAGGAIAQTQSNTAGTIGAGVANAGPAGATAGGLTAGGAVNSQSTGRSDRADRKDRRRGGQATSPAPANSTSTYGSGAVYTDRNNASAGVTSGASASGSGVQSSGTSIEAYGETTRSGSNADVYGDSTATSGTRAR